MAWDRWNLPAHGFNGQMGIPTEMSLSLCENTYYLEAKPVGEIASLYKTTALFDNIRISPEHDFNTRLEDAPYLFKLDGIQIDGGAAEVQIFGRTIRFDFKKNEMTVGNSCAPISVSAAKRDITLIIDRCSIEIYADGGKIYMSCLDNSTLCDRNLPYLVVKADRDMDIASLEMHSLHSIWR